MNDALREVFIMRGLPGAGKTTWLDRYRSMLRPGVSFYVVSADHYHVVNGKYDYRPALAEEAHRDCFAAFHRHCADAAAYTDGVVIAVDNTNTTAAEIAPYYVTAEFFRLPVRIVQVDCPLGIALCRNSHRVPDAAVWVMHRNLYAELLPRRWKFEVVTG